MISYLICQALLIWLNLHIRSFPIHKLLKANFKHLVQSPGQDQGPLILPQNLKYIYKTPYSPQCNSFNKFCTQTPLNARTRNKQCIHFKVLFQQKNKKKTPQVLITTQTFKQNHWTIFNSALVSKLDIISATPDPLSAVDRRVE